MRYINQNHIEAALSRCDRRNEGTNPYYCVASIILVGGVVEGEGFLSDNDLLPFLHFVKSFAQLGASFSDGLKVQACNLKYGDDFLRDTPKADLLIFPWVNKNIGDPDDDKIGAESPLLDLGHTWDNAINESQSAFVGLVTDDSDCVLGRDDVPPNYTELDYMPRRTFFDYPIFQRNMG